VLKGGRERRVVENGGAAVERGHYSSESFGESGHHLGAVLFTLAALQNRRGVRLEPLGKTASPSSPAPCAENLETARQLTEHQDTE